MEKDNFDIITIIGPTASGKTAFAAKLAHMIDAEIISADSRQVYRKMDLGTGKDLEDYIVEGKHIRHHLIDIVEPGTKYNVYRFQHDFLKVYNEIKERNHRVIVCGGSGLYLESILREYRLNPVPQNPELRTRLQGKSLKDLTEILRSYKTLHNTTDVDTPARAIRAIEIADYSAHTSLRSSEFPHLNSLTLGIDIDRETRRKRISNRLFERLNNGMIDEVRNLLNEGICPEDLIYYGLEYKYLTLFVIGEITYEDMIHKLEIAIHQFAKRQMTWFRGMERRGIAIKWLPIPPSQISKFPQYIQEFVPSLTKLLQ